MKKTANFMRLAGLAAVAALAVSYNASANTLTMDLDTKFSGTTDGSPAPWLRAVFTDVTPGVVNLNLTAMSTLSADAHVYNSSSQAWYFNVSSSTLLNAMTFTEIGRMGSFDFNKGSDIVKGWGNLHADNDGYYDWALKFYDSQKSDEFNGGESLTLQISAPGLSASSFNVLAGTGLGSEENGLFYSAARIQGCDWYAGANDTTTTTVPDGGSTVTLFGLALLGVSGLYRKLGRV